MELSPQGIPIIDFSPIIDGQDPTETIDNIATAMETFHCFYVKNHGIKLSLMKNIQSEIREFFGLPLEVKMKFEEGRRQRGYIPFETVNINEFMGRNGYDYDPVERLVFGPPNDEKLPENIFPDKPESFKESLQTMYAGVDKLGSQIVQLIAKAAKVPDEEEFLSICEKSIKGMKVNYFPGNLKPKEKQENRMAEHTDASIITILMNVQPGLKLRLDNGEYVDADPVPGTFFIQAGQRLENMLEDRPKWKAALHKVEWPEGMFKDRVSIAYFVSLYRFVDSENAKPAASG